jgi:hypothetical protein
MAPCLRLPVVAFVFIFLSTSGCKEPVEVKNVKFAKTSAVEDNDKPLAVTEGECREFSSKLENAILKSDGKTLHELMRYDEIVDRSMDGLEIPRDLRRSLLEKMKKLEIPPFATAIVDAVRNGASYKLQAIDADAKPPRVRMRLAMQSAINYHEIHLTRHSNGQVVAHDTYVMLTGELISDTSRRGFLLAMPLQPGNAQGADREYLDNIQKLVAMARAHKQGLAKEAIAQYRQLPQSLQRNKALRLMMIDLASSLGNEEYVRLVEDFRRDYPDEPAVDLISLQYLRQTKKYDEYLKCMERVEKSVGGDAYLDAARAETMIEADRRDDARRFSEKAVAQDASLRDGYVTRVRVAMLDKNHQDTLTWLKRDIDKFNTPADLKGMKVNPEFAAFVESPQFQTFEKWYLAREK